MNLFSRRSFLVGLLGSLVSLTIPTLNRAYAWLLDKDESPPDHIAPKLMVNEAKVRMGEGNLPKRITLTSGDIDEIVRQRRYEIKIFGDILDQIRDRLDIIEVVSNYVALSRTGENFKGLCPYHSDKTPSLTVSPSRRIFHCYRCHWGGDVFLFVMKMEGITFHETVRNLGRRVGISVSFPTQIVVRKGRHPYKFNQRRDSDGTT